VIAMTLQELPPADELGREHLELNRRALVGRSEIIDQVQGKPLGSLDFSFGIARGDGLPCQPVGSFGHAKGEGGWDGKVNM